MRVYTLTKVLDPADAHDVATKQYVDGANKAFVLVIEDIWLLETSQWEAGD